MDDLISRQAAVEVADAVWCVTGDTNAAKIWDQIKNLPSAHCDNCPYPDQHVPQEDAVSRKSVIDALEKYFDGLPIQVRYDLIEITKKLPSVISSAQPEVLACGEGVLNAQPELIRCKDCKHYNAGFECLIEGYGIERNKNWYCADAERRTDE